MAASTTKAQTTATVNPALIATGPGGVVSLKGKKRRLTGAELKARTDQARSITGYNSTSPIFGKQTPDVLIEIDTMLVEAERQLGAGSYATAEANIKGARQFIDELQRRIATRKIAFAR